ncbi:Phosphatidate cytidylyltransferase [Entamoeba marina]
MLVAPLDFFLSLISITFTTLTLVLGLVLSSKGIISSSTSRKVVHVVVGFSQLLLWGFYSESVTARIFGCLMCLLYFVVFLVVGLGILKGPLSTLVVESVTRNKDPKEVLHGPMIYCLSFVLLTLIFWKNYPASVIGLAVMITGDGLAEVIGKLYGKHVIINPWNMKKSIEGSFSVAIFGFIGAVIVSLFVFGEVYLFTSLFSGIVGMIVEFFSPPNTDNLLVPLACCLVGIFIKN